VLREVENLHLGTLPKKEWMGFFDLGAQMAKAEKGL